MVEYAKLRLRLKLLMLRLKLSGKDFLSGFGVLDRRTNCLLLWHIASNIPTVRLVRTPVKRIMHNAHNVIFRQADTPLPSAFPAFVSQVSVKSS